MDAVNRLGAKVRRLRQDAGLLASELAEYAGISRSRLTSLENGYEGPSIETIEAICKVLGVTTDYLLADLARSDVARVVTSRRLAPKRTESTEPGPDGTCQNTFCATSGVPDLADFLGHDVIGHKALNGLIAHTDVRTIGDLRNIKIAELKYVPHFGAKTLQRIRQCMTSTATLVTSDQDFNSVVTELVEGERVYRVRRTLGGFTALVSPDGDRWFEAEVTLRVRKASAPETFHTWEEDDTWTKRQQ